VPLEPVPMPLPLLDPPMSDGERFIEPEGAEEPEPRPVAPLPEVPLGELPVDMLPEPVPVCALFMQAVRCAASVSCWQF
jgi:hypothetical protein